MSPKTGVAAVARRPRRASSEDDKARRRESLLAAAKKVFAEKGFHGTTMGDVAKAGRSSYGTVYWYFPSKDALFHELMDNQKESLRRHILSAVVDSAGANPGLPDLTATLEAAIRATFEFFEADKATVKLLFRDSYAMGNRFEKHLFAIYEGFISDLSDLITEAQKRGEIVEAPAHVVAFSIAALVGQLAYRRLTTDDGLDAGVIAQFVVNLLLDGLRPR
ncbi:MAG TPA: TetR/AcrR family transcriptional regulator [Acidimicrobiales bacterium]|nr:TetR/AcrR family transcriptional regulator [Acidimicrobiales bacterium]